MFKKKFLKNILHNTAYLAILPLSVALIDAPPSQAQNKGTAQPEGRLKGGGGQKENEDSQAAD